MRVGVGSRTDEAAQAAHEGRHLGVFHQGRQGLPPAREERLHRVYQDRATLNLLRTPPLVSPACSCAQHHALTNMRVPKNSDPCAVFSVRNHVLEPA